MRGCGQLAGLEAAPGLDSRKHLRQAGPEPRDGVAFEVHLHPSHRHDDRRQRIQRGVAEARAGCGRGAISRAAGGGGVVNMRMAMRTASSASSVTPVEMCRSNRTSSSAESSATSVGHGVAAQPHEHEAGGHDPVQPARGEVVPLARRNGRFRECALSFHVRPRRWCASFMISGSRENSPVRRMMRVHYNGGERGTCRRAARRAGHS